MAACVIRIFVRFPTGGICQVIARPSDLLRDLKPSVARWGNLTSDFAFTKPSGLPIQDDATVQDAATDGATLHVRHGAYPGGPSLAPTQFGSVRTDSITAAGDEFATRLVRMAPDPERRAETEAAQRLQEFARKLRAELDEHKRQVEASLLQRRRVLMDMEARLAQREAALNAVLAQTQQRTDQMRSSGADQRARLNVGGTLFVTTRTTLSKFPDSFFGTLLSGRYQVPKDPDGSVFIDRAPDMFPYVLEFLRDGTVSVEQPTEVFLHKLRRDFEFYGLPVPQLNSNTQHQRPTAESTRPAKVQRLLTIPHLEQ